VLNLVALGQAGAFVFDGWLCSLSNLRDMETLGLFMHDLNTYDCSKQMVMAGWQHASRLECSIEKVSLLLMYIP